MGNREFSRKTHSLGMADLKGGEIVGYLKPKGARLVVDLKNADEYEAPKPFKRFMKVLIDEESFPGAPLCIATPSVSSAYPPPFTTDLPPPRKFGDNQREICGK